MGSGLHVRVPRASPCPWVAHPVSGRPPATCPPFRTRVRSGSGCPRLNLATPNHSSAHSTKGTPSRDRSRSDRPEAHGFRISFTPLGGVLFTVPSRYWFPIGRWRCLALGGGPPRFPPDSACRAVLTHSTHPRGPRVAYGTLTRSGRPFQRRSADSCSRGRGVGCPLRRSRPTPDQHPQPGYPLTRFGLLPFRSPLLRESSLLLGVLRCFSSPGAPRRHSTCRGDPRRHGPGCPIRIPLDRRLPAPPQGVSPRGRVLPRQSAPRHPPCAHSPGSLLPIQLGTC